MSEKALCPWRQRSKDLNCSAVGAIPCSSLSLNFPNCKVGIMLSHRIGTRSRVYNVCESAFSIEDIISETMEPIPSSPWKDVNEVMAI